MKNFINASLKTKISALSLAICLIFASTALMAQNVSVVIDTPTDGSSYCAEFGQTVTFTATGYDAMNNPISDANIGWLWTGPGGFNSTTPEPMLTMDNTARSGDYIVRATFASGQVARDTVNITVEPLLTWTCPTRPPVIVTPDLMDPDCSKNLTFGGFTIGEVNCTSLAYTWAATFETQGGMIISPDPMTVPPSPAIDNFVMNQTYGNGMYYADLPFGFHELRIDIMSGSTIYTQCIIDVNVVESRGNLACNDLVNMTLDGDCEAVVTPDMILEGEYCFDLFGLTMEQVASGDVTNGTGSVMIFEPGLYNVTVTGQTGISCWGQVLAEDKSAPVLDCDTVYMYCSTLGTAPGDEIRGFDRGWVINETVAAGDTETFNLLLDDIEGEIQEVILNFEADIDDVSDLEMSLTSPEGTTRILLDLDEFSDPCDNSNINVCLSDDASNSYAMFGSPQMCRRTRNAFIGSFRPKQLFNAFNGEMANDGGNQVWQLEVVNNGSGTSDIEIIEADLQVYTIEGFLLTSSDIIESNGCSDDQSFTFEDEQMGTNCEDGFWQHIIRTWRVTNTASGLSASCDQNIFLRQWTINEIIWPKSYNDLDQPSLRCNELSASDLNANNVPKPDRTGRPRVPFGDLCGNFQVTYSDLTFDICGPLSKKTIRTWSVLDWCTNDIAQFEQTIKVVDDQPIVFSCVPDFISPDDAEDIGYDIGEESYVVGSNPYTCDGNWEIVYPLIFDNACDDSLSIEVYYLVDNDENPNDPPVNGVYIQTNVVDKDGRQVNNFLSDGIAHTIRNLPVGRRTWIKMVATDECGNTGECFTEVDVVDRTKPIPVCIEFTVAAFGETGIAKLHAESLDNGSWDNCGVVKYEVKAANEPPSQYTDTYNFSCSCSNPNRMMHLRVTDAAGNTNTCRVEVELQDNLDPIRTKTPQSAFEFDCSESPVDLNDIIDQSLTEFEYIDNCFNVNNQNPVLNINVSVVNPTAARAPFESTGCGFGSRSVLYEILDQCGDQIGTFTQSFFFTNSSIENPSTFSVTRWPRDYDVTNCTTVDGLEPENLPSANNADNIIVNSSICNDIAIGWDDVIFPDVNDACLKILRTWQVIDWCIADRTSIQQATRTHTQVIKVFDNVPPNINVPSSVVIDSKSTNCFTSVDTLALVADITDACTDMFETQEVTFYHQIEYPDGSMSNVRTSIDANGSYPFGTSVITWYAEDHCGNFTSRETRVIVNDRKAPTPYCLGSVVTATMNTDGSAEIWASDFDLGGFDNYTGNAACNNFNSLDVYFLQNNIKTYFLIFDCDDILNGISQLIPLRVYYEDEYGNTDFCIVQLNLQDNQSDLCEDIDGSMIAGRVHTEFEEMLEDVQVTLRNNTLDFSSLDDTDRNGYYAFEDLPTSTNYSISSRMEDDALNGVSTLDLVLIQRHILGLSSLGSPFKIIAADADNSGNVSAIDLLTIRKLILGITTEFPNGQAAWRFPEEGQQFLDVQAPFPYNEEIDIFNLQGDMLNQDFIAVKIGDVNDSADLDFQGINRQSELKSNQDLTLIIDEMNLDAGDEAIIPVYAKGLREVLGLQNTFSFDNNALEFVEVRASVLDIDEENLGLAYVNEGLLSMSWNDTDAVSADEDEVLFELVFNVKENINLSDKLYINSAVTHSEAYDSDLKLMDMKLDFRGTLNDEFVLFQNMPNPFLETTDIRFKIPASSGVIFKVYDVTGREIYSETSTFDAGLHTIRLTRDQLQSTGVMYYTIETDFGTDSKKMIQIR